MTEITPSAVHASRIFTEVLDAGTRRVLVVDDEESIRVSIGKFLRSRGYHVTVASSGAEAIASIHSERFDVLLCDIRMPDMTGLDVVPRAIEQIPDIAVLMLTAVNDAPTATEALSLGAVDYLMKPIEFSDLARAVERALVKRDLDIQQRNVERFVRDEVARRTAELRAEQRVVQEAAFRALCAIVDEREQIDLMPLSRSRRIAALSAAIGRAMELDPDTAARLRIAARLHSVGTAGEGILGTVPAFAAPLADILCWRAHWDGTGSPADLRGDSIPLASRIVAVAVAFDLLTTLRPDQPSIMPAEAMAALAQNAGCQYDPAVVAALEKVLRDPDALPLREPVD